MPPPAADDPLRTTDHAPNAAAPRVDLTVDIPPASDIGTKPLPPAGQATATYLPGRAPHSQDATPRECPTQSFPSVPGYVVEGVLGRGGMGVVYKARHLALKPWRSAPTAACWRRSAATSSAPQW